MQNIELKVRHDNLSAARARARELGARHVWTLTQRDTYFNVPKGRLKVREMPEEAELIWYTREDDTRPRMSNYTRVPLRDASAALALLAGTYEQAAVVVKRRELWQWRNVRVHLDDVRGLGTFLELEGVVDRLAACDVTRARVSHVVQVLDLGACTAVPESYGDLIAVRCSPRAWPH